MDDIDVPNARATIPSPAQTVQRVHAPPTLPPEIEVLINATAASERPPDDDEDTDKLEAYQKALTAKTNPVSRANNKRTRAAAPVSSSPVASSSKDPAPKRPRR